MNFQPKFEQAQSYQDFLQQYATPQQRDDWQQVRQAIALTPSQSETLQQFVRQLNVLVIAGTWCGDCVNQCPIFEAFAASNPVLNIRYLDRDAHRDLGDRYQICGGNRVPTVFFLSEDYQMCGIYGDRTLAKYRQMARQLSGAACPVGFGVDPALLSEMTEEWLREFERVQWMLRFSARLREIHQD
jgi:thiol-disulfide isomerase/thioredoxin